MRAPWCLATKARARGLRVSSQRPIAFDVPMCAAASSAALINMRAHLTTVVSLIGYRSGLPTLLMERHPHANGRFTQHAFLRTSSDSDRGIGAPPGLRSCNLGYLAHRHRYAFIRRRAGRAEIRISEVSLTAHPDFSPL